MIGDYLNLKNVKINIGDVDDNHSQIVVERRSLSSKRKWVIFGFALSALIGLITFATSMAITTHYLSLVWGWIGFVFSGLGISLTPKWSKCKLVPLFLFWVVLFAINTTFFTFKVVNLSQPLPMNFQIAKFDYERFHKDWVDLIKHCGTYHFQTSFETGKPVGLPFTVVKSFNPDTVIPFIKDVNLILMPKNFKDTGLWNDNGVCLGVKWFHRIGPKEFEWANFKQLTAQCLLQDNKEKFDKCEYFGKD